MKDLQKYVVTEFGSKITQEFYVKKAEEGFWPAEEAVIKRFFKPKSSVLDIGCGTGRTTITLYKLGYKVVGTDITPEMIKNAKKISKGKKLSINYQIGDATRLKFKNGSFDNALFSNNGWTQIPGRENRIKALREIHRILRPNGYYVFTTHIRRLKGFTFFWIKQWMRFYLLRPLGLKIDEIDFGDRFFERENSGTMFVQKQFIHIPSLSEVKQQLNEVGFVPVLIDRPNKIAKNDKNSSMVYVCRKSD